MTLRPVTERFRGAGLRTRKADGKRKRAHAQLIRAPPDGSHDPSYFPRVDMVTSTLPSAFARSIGATKVRLVSGPTRPKPIIC